MSLETDAFDRLGVSKLERAKMVLARSNMDDDARKVVGDLLGELDAVHADGKRCHSCVKFDNRKDGSGIGECREWGKTVHVSVATDIVGEGAVSAQVHLAAFRNATDGCERWVKRG